MNRCSAGLSARARRARWRSPLMAMVLAPLLFSVATGAAWAVDASHLEASGDPDDAIERVVDRVEEALDEADLPEGASSAIGRAFEQARAGSTETGASGARSDDAQAADEKPSTGAAGSSRASAGKAAPGADSDEPSDKRRDPSGDAGALTSARSYVDGAGNVFVAGDDDGAARSEKAVTDEGRDLVFFGNSGTVEGAAVGGDILAAAASVSIEGSAVAGSIRAAAESVEVAGTEVAGNATLAGRNVGFVDGSSAGAVYLAGETATFSGVAGSVDIASRVAFVSGKVSGDMAVYAQEVHVDKGASVDGTLTVYSPTRPEVPSTARVGEFRYVQTEPVNVNFDFRARDLYAGTFLQTLDDIEPEFMDGYLVPAVLASIACILCALVLSVFLRGPVEGCARIAKSRFIAVILSGVVGVVLCVPVLVLLTLLVATIPLAVALGLTMGAVTAVCVPFTAASLGRMVLGGWHRAVSAILFGLLFGILGILPYTGVFVACFSFVFMLGYLVQLIRRGMRGTAVADERASGGPQGGWSSQSGSIPQTVL